MPKRKRKYIDFWQSYGFLNVFLGHICPSGLQGVKINLN